nr:hypothetical protein [Tanacetum cinerariifolium]GEY36739.1 hypothetical protein [Tanacetum cinerariifolium]
MHGMVSKRSGFVSAPPRRRWLICHPQPATAGKPPQLLVSAVVVDSWMVMHGSGEVADGVAWWRLSGGVGGDGLNRSGDGENFGVRRKISPENFFGRRRCGGDRRQQVAGRRLLVG